jgi:hypothetical protein
MGLAPSGNGGSPGKSAVAKVLVPSFSQPRRVAQQPDIRTHLVGTFADGAQPLFLEGQLAGIPTGRKSNQMQSPSAKPQRAWFYVPSGCLAMFLVAGSLTAADTEQQSGARPEPEQFSRQVQPLLNRLCLECHGPKHEEAEINLGMYDSAESVLKNRETWSKISEMLQFGAMPPDDAAQPTQAERELLVTWINGFLALDCSQIRDPGRVTLRRLNRVEYDNTIRDLTGLDLKLARDFPSDDVGEGFDNIGDVLSLPPLLLEKYVDAAVKIAEQAIRADAASMPRQRLERRDLTPRAAAREVLERFATRAYRRPVQTDEVDRLVRLASGVLDQGGSFEQAIQTAVAAVLVSPHFLFRVEDDRAAEGSSPVRELNGYELASRLSYFLWSSMPDDELFALASRGELRQEPVLAAQVRRMIADPRAPRWSISLPLSG